MKRSTRYVSAAIFVIIGVAGCILFPLLLDNNQSKNANLVRALWTTAAFALMLYVMAVASREQLEQDLAYARESATRNAATEAYERKQEWLLQEFFCIRHLGTDQIPDIRNYGIWCEAFVKANGGYTELRKKLEGRLPLELTPPGAATPLTDNQRQKMLEVMEHAWPRPVR